DCQVAPGPTRQAWNLPGPRLFLHPQLAGRTALLVESRSDSSAPRHHLPRALVQGLRSEAGPNVELSTANTPTPDLLTIEEGATIAEEVALGPSRVENGWMTIAPTKVGKRTFLGNSAVVPAGTTIGE